MHEYDEARDVVELSVLDELQAAVGQLIQENAALRNELRMRSEEGTKESQHQGERMRHLINQIHDSLSPKTTGANPIGKLRRY